MTYKVTIGGYEVLATQPVGYSRTSGSSPAMLSVRLPAHVADTLTARSGRNTPHTLRVEFPDGEAEAFESGPWYWSSQQPTEAPQIGAIVFEDRRIWWGRRYLNRSYNLRRRVGFERVVPLGPGDSNFATEQVVPEVAWRQRTLIDGVNTWSPLDILLDVLTSVDPDAEIVIDRSATTVPNPPLDDVVIAGYGGEVVEQALRQLPELTVTVRADGAVKIYSRAAGLAEDERIAGALGSHKVGSSALLVQDLAAVCPPEIHVLFQVESEVRLDAIEGEREGESGGSAVASTTQAFEAEPPVSEPDRELRNVAVVADYELEVNGSTVVQGTYVPWLDYMEALPEAPTAVVITEDHFKRAAIPGSSVMQSFAQIGRTGDTDDNWPARIQSLASSYRTLYRMPRGWVDSAISIKATRVSTVDQQTGAPARSIVLADYFIVPSEKARIRQGEVGADWVQFGRNVAGWAPQINRKTIPAPARVMVVDEEQGILKFNFLVDPWAESAQVLPSQINILRIPVSAPRQSQDSRAVALNAVDDIGVLPKLADGHRLATILTMVPVPDTEARMYRAKVKPADVIDKLPREVREVVTRARGQIQEIGISPGNDQTARIPWSNDAAEVIERLFLAPDSVTSEQLQPYVINDAPRTNVANERGASNGPSLRIIAEAVAVRRWCTYAKHLQGTMTGGASSGWRAELGGYAESITSTLSLSGEDHTVSYAAQLPLFDWQTILDPGTRALLFRQVLRGGGQ